MVNNLSRSALPGFLIALAILLGGLVLAFTLGRYPVSLKDIFEILASRLSGRPSSTPLAVQDVVLLVRGPRVLAAVLVGAALAVSGTAFQGLFRSAPARATWNSLPPRGSIDSPSARETPRAIPRGTARPCPRNDN
jgi:ABC-type Fe3+-siderophore transport system permease subunit